MLNDFRLCATEVVYLSLWVSQLMKIERKYSNTPFLFHEENPDPVLSLSNHGRYIFFSLLAMQ